MISRVYKPGHPPTESKSQRRRKNRKNRNANESTAPGLEALTDQPSKSLMHHVGDAIHGSSSHKGAFWIGVTIAAVSLFKNTEFYTQVGFTTFKWAVLPALFAGLAFALITTYFESAPLIQKKSYKSALYRVFLIASRPSRLPQVKNTQHHAPHELHNQYRNVDKEFNSFCTLMRWACIGTEVIIGLLGLAHAGSGMQAIGHFMIFIMSIFGAVYGLVMAVRAYDLELSPTVRKQFNDLTTKDKPLQF